MKGKDKVGDFYGGSNYIPTRRLTRYSALVCLFLLACLLAISALHESNDQSSSEQFYAICSEEGTKAIYTVDKDNTSVQCALVKGGKFLDTGDLNELQLRHKASFSVQYIPRDAAVIPGMTDSHVHGLYYGLLKQLPLGGTDSIEETLARVRVFIESDPDLLRDKSVWIEGFGWDHTKWGSGENYPTAADMESDNVLKDRLISLRSHDAHAYWVSPKVLASIKVPDSVPGGKIFRYPDGTPTGVFMDNARDLIQIPTPSDDILSKRWQLTVKDFWEQGFVAVHDALLQDDTIDFFHNQAKNDSIGLRVYGMKEFDLGLTGYWGNTTEKIHGAGNNKFTMRSAKFVADGAMRTGGAALYEPYSDDPSSTGFFRIPPEVLNEYIPKFIADGWQTNIHAIGDRTNGAVLDALEKALQNVNASEIRPRIEHAQIMKHSDAARVGPLGVISSIQPSHCPSDMWYAEDRLGSRIDELYPFKSLQDSGSMLTLGSDSPVEDMSPFLGIYSAITRLSVDGTSPKGPDGFFPEQRISRLDALRGYTINPAYASFMENEVGSIEPGKKADFVVVDRDLMTVEPKELLNVKVLTTVMDGVVVFG